MDEKINRILDFVCDNCDVTREEILSHSKHMPIPLARGFFWYIIKRTTGYSCRRIAELTPQDGTPYTPAGVGSAINRTTDAISHDRLWANRWDKVIKEFDLARMVTSNENIELTISVPQGMKNKVNINIKEKK